MNTNKDLVSVTFMMAYWGPIVDEFFRRIKQQKTSFPVEVVAVYLGSDDGSFKKLQTHADKTLRLSKDDYPQEVLNDLASNISSSDYFSTRDIACEIASGNYLVTMSIDALPADEHWLENIARPLIKGKADIVQGEVQCPDDDSPHHPDFFYWERDYKLYFTSEAKDFYKKYGHFEGGDWGFSGLNIAFTKELWEKTGFDGARYNDDNVFQKKAWAHQPKIVYEESAVVLHAHSYKTIRSLFNRSSNEGLGWKDLRVNYSLIDLLYDMTRIDLHLETLKVLLAGKLKYASEILFHFIRPMGLYWGNHFATSLYSEKRK